MRLLPEAPVDSIVDATRTNLTAGLITEGDAVATVRDVKGCSAYGARVLLGIEFDPPPYRGGGLLMPTWEQKIDLRDVWKNPEMAFPEQRDAVVKRIRRSGWPERNQTVAELLDEIEDTTTGDEFDGPWNAIYDEADADRVWIATC
jgi:hypothetical protein